ncbi:hypothetical protein M404DRAFT_991381 [Pisolithus tinctorius Marx 270]|uniref:Uncharacterized protein n=1 Tax=Pisolithus tinctorius Marx 270 TaxID=870435 RepID=A0A0C3PK93_PISTI|nr:hypothetical protein M404DRAFT_991381 [Pisolithus tinctorius Marx 270]
MPRCNVASKVTSCTDVLVGSASAMYDRTCIMDAKKMARYIRTSQYPRLPLLHPEGSFDWLSAEDKKALGNTMQQMCTETHNHGRRGCTDGGSAMSGC